MTHLGFGDCDGIGRSVCFIGAGEYMGGYHAEGYEGLKARQAIEEFR